MFCGSDANWSAASEAQGRMERYLCIHCHFYQPPRENPWLAAIELQDSASPYHDWNERIAAECYAPNAASRILDGQGRIAKITNNYSRISFNFAPTLLSWLEEKAPWTYEQILAADRQSRELFSGHGAALAQAYNHMILPLANARDKVHASALGHARFPAPLRPRSRGHVAAGNGGGRGNPGVPELAGHQVHHPGAASGAALAQPALGRLDDADGAAIDPSRAYHCNLPSGRDHQLVLLRRPDLARGGLRKTAHQRRELSPAACSPASTTRAPGRS